MDIYFSFEHLLQSLHNHNHKQHDNTYLFFCFLSFTTLLNLENLASLEGSVSDAFAFVAGKSQLNLLCCFCLLSCQFSMWNFQDTFRILINLMGSEFRVEKQLFFGCHFSAEICTIFCL